MYLRRGREGRRGGVCGESCCCTALRCAAVRVLLRAHRKEKTVVMGATLA